MALSLADNPAMNDSQSIVLAVLVPGSSSSSIMVFTCAGESLGNGIQNDQAKNARPEVNDEQETKRANEQPGSPVFVRVEFKHGKSKHWVIVSLVIVRRQQRYGFVLIFSR